MTLSKSQVLYQKIVELHSSGTSTQQEIATSLEISITTVERYLSKWRRGIPVEEVRQVGRPTKLSESIRGKITAQLELDPLSNSRDITQAITDDGATNVCERTVRNFMGRLSYLNSLPRTIPLITNAQKEARVRWANAHREFDWSRIYYSDETTIQLSPNLTRAWHKKGHRPIVARPKYPAKVMFWAAVSVSRKSPLYELSGTMNALGYQALLADHFLPWFRPQHTGHLTLQQDNAPPHTAKTTKRFFSDNNIDVLPWPASSPDLNPIENLWGILKVRVDRRKPKNKEELITYAKEEWNGIEMETVRRTIESLPNRIELVIENGGNKIDY
jgi:transposase